MIKRTFDIIASGLGIILVLPLLCIVAILIKLDSDGPILYCGKRVGKDGRIFKIFKFRTMVHNAELFGGSCTATKDPRITRIGKVLRKYKIDELPQLFNVFIGDMSLVGPRPDVEKYISTLCGDNRKILELRPGITDWASVCNFQEGEILDCYEDPDEAYVNVILPVKLNLQMIYYNNHSLWIDLKIILFTFIKLFHRGWQPELHMKPLLVESGLAPQNIGFQSAKV